MCVTSIHCPGDAFILSLKCRICGFADAGKDNTHKVWTRTSRFWLLTSKLSDSWRHLGKKDFWKSERDLAVTKPNKYIDKQFSILFFKGWEIFFFHLNDLF